MSKQMSKRRKAWCERYEQETGFEPLMDDFLYGDETFHQAVHKSVRWFEDWSSDAHLNIGRGIPK